MDQIEKKRLWIFIAVAYGFTYVMSIFMFIGFKKDYDLTVFVNTQMMYPACGVILGKILAKKEGESLPLGGYITFLVTTVLMMLLSIGSIFGSGKTIKLPGIEMSPWDIGSQIFLIIGGIAVYIMFWTCGKEKRDNAGLSRNKPGLSCLMVVLFIILYFARQVISSLLSDAVYNRTAGAHLLEEAVSNPTTYVLAFALIPAFFISFMAFLGEEYGWRYYLQPIMLKKFGKRKGILLLGLVWAFWHICVDFLYYSEETGPLMFVAQIITCITVGIFFGYAYMKTQNIWVVTIMHYLNNNLVAILAGGDPSILQNQIVHAKDIPIMIVQGIVFAIFIISPIYGKLKKETETE